RPFLLSDPRKWPRDVKAAWNAVGAEATPAYLPSQAETYERVARCCETLSYVSVRNELTARFVRRCGFRGDVHVVPDPTLVLELPASDVAERTLRRAGVDTDAFVIGLSVGNAVRDARAQHFHAELFGALAKLVAKRAVEVVVFPFGEIYGDAELARIAHGAIPGAKIITEPLGALDRWRLVGALDLYVCARWHALLAAFAQDVPFLVMDEYLSDATASSKIRELVVDLGLEELYLAPLVSMHPAAKLETALALAENLAFEEKRAVLRKKLDAHYAAMTRALA
ncbi:MAG TPA: polysaccharide pyruvyl transferase family protein, partial [Polyangiaceae bacterium]